MRRHVMGIGLVMGLGAAVAGVGGGGCSAKLGGTLTVDGTPFQPASCRSGAVYGFTGVELTDGSGRRLRMASRADGRASALVFAAGAATGDDLGVCGPFQLIRQSSTINNVTNVQGQGALDCSGSGHTIKGTVEFENCH